jgi:hypothetical protein
MPVAAAYVSVKTIDGLTLYAVARRRSDLGYGNTFTSSVEGFVPGHWYSSGSNNYAIAGSKDNSMGFGVAEYSFQFPAFPAAEYYFEVYTQLGAHPALSDGLFGWLLEGVFWNGTAILPKITPSGNEVVDASVVNRPVANVIRPVTIDPD